MTKKELADLLNGREYGYNVVANELVEKAKESGLVIVYGASDDLMEFRGAIEDEGGCYDGGTVWFDKTGVSQDGELRANEIKALWCEGRDEDGNLASWSYETQIPHETFKIYEDGELYCIGIVFSIEDVA